MKTDKKKERKKKQRNQGGDKNKLYNKIKRKNYVIKWKEDEEICHCIPADSETKNVNSNFKKSVNGSDSEDR